MKSAYFAGGCFWCITPVFAEKPGVISVTSGYCGGDEADPSYEDVKSQATGHRETIKIDYDENIISYSALLQIFFENVDITDGGGQFIDRGRSYTLAIYYTDEKEKEAANKELMRLKCEGTVSLETYKCFYSAEEYHQDFYLKEPEKFKKEMTLYEAIFERHSVRRYTDNPIEPEKAAVLQAKIDEINKNTGLNFSLCLDEPEAFMANKPSYGSFAGCRNYFVLAAEKGRDTDIGYYGEELVLLSQTLGLNTCWVALTFEKNKVPVKLPDGVKIYDVVALGYGQNQGVPHKSKPTEKLYRTKGDVPEWFLKGMEAAALAPTAINQQRFIISYDNGKVSAKAQLGPCSKTDLGIVKYHFELGAGKDNFVWEE